MGEDTSALEHRKTGKQRNRQIQRVGPFVSWVREGSLRWALFPVVHSHGALVTPVSFKPTS